MSFLRGLIKGKDQPEKDDKNNQQQAAPRPEDLSAPDVIPKDFATRPAMPSSGAVPRQNPLAGKEAAAPVHRTTKSRIPTEEQRKHFKDAAQRSKDSRMGQILVKHGLVNDEMVREALGSEAGAPLPRTLVEHGFVREDDILEALASELGMERINLGAVQVSPELIKQVDKKIARDYKVFPVAFNDHEVTIAIADPLNIQVQDDLRRLLGRHVKTVIAAEEDIDRFYKRYYETDEIKAVYENLTDEMNKPMDENEVDLADDDENAPPVVKFVDLIFKQAVHDRASDIHIEPTRTSVVIRFRVDGVLAEMPSPPKKWQNAILSRLKVLSGMDLAEKRIPQDGRIKLNMPDKKLDLRVSSLPSIYGESIVMRVLDQQSVMLGLEDVGFLPDNITLFNSLIRTPTGVILMTGPTGSGKTTTLYSALQTLNSPEVKIVTIENPVEYMIDGINQVQVNEEVGLDFKLGLRSILRQSPDVLLVGEMRDLETAEIGIRAALTGHLVFSTLHTNDAPSAPGRLIDMGVKPFLVASSLQAVVAQRLLRRICGQCKKRHVYTEEEFIEVGATEDELAQRETLPTMMGEGCDRCNKSGYKGRTAIHEIMVMDARLRQMVIKGESGFRVKKVAIRGGMRSLRMDGWQKVKLGQTTLAEVFKTTMND